MRKHDRVITPKGVGVVEGVHGDQITVRLIDSRFPLPEWTVFPRKQLRLVRDKKTVEVYGEARY
jgi:hypothetical protein